MIVPAAGIGARMGNKCPKQYLPLDGKPILQHTLERLNRPWIAGIVVCVAQNDTWFAQLKLPRQVIQAPGGAQRCHSVLNGLYALSSQAQPQDWVLVHDAARPCVRIQDIDTLRHQLSHHPVGGLLALPVRDTMKRANPQAQSVETISRLHLWHALTPQMFRFELLTQALQQALTQGIIVTDEAQAIEHLGYQPQLIEGHADNIKITHPADLTLAQLYLRHQNAC